MTIAVQNGGGLRASIDAGPVTMGEVLTVLPFQNNAFDLPGRRRDAGRRAGKRGERGRGGRRCRFLQVAGMR